MKLDAKQKIALALANFVMRVLFPYDTAMLKAWQDFKDAITQEVVQP